MSTNDDDEYGTVSVAADQLRAFIERIERMEEEKKEVVEGIKEIFAEAKGNGFCVKTLRKIIAMRKKTSAELQEEMAMLDLYAAALKMEIGR